MEQQINTDHYRSVVFYHGHCTVIKNGTLQVVLWTITKLFLKYDAQEFAQKFN